MSTVKTTNLQHPSSAAANITLGSDGSVVLPAGFTGGIGSNVVTGTTSTTTSTTSTSYVDTSLAVTITPTSASSKVLVLVQVHELRFDSSAGSSLLRLYRGDTSGTALDADTRYASVNTGVTRLPASLVILDSPSTTSATTYTLGISTSNASNTAGVYGFQNIVAIEVAA